ncbi:MAG: LemA family protein [Eubacteriales bacterium]|nr:LemA family protein [Eubacteriales bacterium]
MYELLFLTGTAVEDAIDNHRNMIGAIVLLLVLLLVSLISSYNKLMRERENLRNAKGQVAAQIESRWDQVSSLIGAAKKYSEHEASVMTELAMNRSALTKESRISDFDIDDSAFSNMLGRLMAVVEAYPELKADTIYQEAMRAIQECDERVRYARMIYNDSVTSYNRLRLRFPMFIAASILGFRPGDYFENKASKANMPQW